MITAAMYCSFIPISSTRFNSIPDSQFYRLSAFANANHIVVTSYYEDDSISIKGSYKKGFSQLLLDYECNLFEYVLVTKIDLIPFYQCNSSRKPIKIIAIDTLTRAYFTMYRE